MNKNILESINPKNNSLIYSWDVPSKDKLDFIIKNTFDAQTVWESKDVESRLNLIRIFGTVLEDKIKELSLIIADEMGKPLSQGKLEIEKCIWLCKYYYDLSKNFLKKDEIDTHYLKSYVSYRPLGVILGIMPWNFPFWQVLRFSIPSLIVGNGVLLKHASNVQACANELENCFLESGFPENIFKNLQIPSEIVSRIIKNEKINGVAVTGSVKTGRSVAKIAGKYLKKVVLELGGNDPYLILSDAKIDEAISACVDGRLLNAGQSCISAKRIIVTKNNIEKFIEKLVNILKLKIVGDPYDDVDVGPLASVSARDDVHNLVQSSIRKGAILNMGGKIPNSTGAYYPITVLSNVRPGMPVFNEEVFGPVFSIIKAEDDQDAIDLANKSKFGLGAAIFTSDLNRGEKIAKEKIQAGMCFVNEYVISDPRIPFGGIKMSGYGRELSSYGLMEFVNIKTIVVDNSES